MKVRNLIPLGCAFLLSGLTAAAQEAGAPVNVLLNKTIVAVAGNPAADNEGPEKLIDGDPETKYCIIQGSPYVEIDAEGYFNFTGFKFFDCKTQEEEENASAITIKLSMDGKIWETVSELTNVDNQDIKDVTLTAPKKARFVRFEPKYKKCARMWELEGYGTDVTSFKAELQSDAALQMNTGDDAEIKVGYTMLNGSTAEVTCNASCEKDNLEVGTPVKGEGFFTIPVKAVKKGNAAVDVTLVCDGEIHTFRVNAKIKSTEAVSLVDAVEITNWGEDFIAEAIDEDSYDKGIKSDYGLVSKVFYSAAVAEEGALCDEEGVIEVPTSGNVYVAKVDGKNALKVDRNQDPVSLRFKEPRPTEKVNLLVFADCTNSIDLKATIVYDDDSESDPEQKTLSNWKYDGPDGFEAITDLGVLENSLYDGLSVLDAKNYRVYEMEIPADQYKNAKEIKLEASGGSYGDAAYVIGVNAHDVNGVSTKHLEASLAEKTVKVKEFATANIVVNYKLNNIEGLDTQLEYSAEPSKEAVTVGEIVNDPTAGTLTIPVTGNYAALATVDVNLAFGEQTMKLVAQVLVKTSINANADKALEITNWKHDVIAEATPVSEHADTKLDQQGWVFFTDDIHPEGALAGDERLIVTEDNNVYKLAPYNGKNATVIMGLGGSMDAKETFTLATPIRTEQVNALVMSANNVSNIEITVNYEDGTSSETAQKESVDDWYSAAPDGTEAVYGLGRISLSDGNIHNERYFRLFELPIETESKSKVASITINNNGYQSYLTVLGFNAAPKENVGVESVDAAEGRIPEAYYTLEGVRVQNPGKGVWIVRYSDGSYSKTTIR